MAGDTVKLAVRNVSKSFRMRGRRQNEDRLLNVLGDVSFEVHHGEVVSLIGESGCGKTTLLKIIQGLIRSDAGTILVDGVPVTKPGRDRLERARSLLDLVGLAQAADSVSAPAVGGDAAARGLGTGAGDRSGDSAHGRTVQCAGRPDA